MSSNAGGSRFLRVEEAARELQISRTAAYELARRWLVSGGREGLPAIRLGRSIRIPAAAVDRLAKPDQSGPGDEPAPDRGAGHARRRGVCGSGLVGDAGAPRAQCQGRGRGPRRRRVGTFVGSGVRLGEDTVVHALARLRDERLVEFVGSRFQPGADRLALPVGALCLGLSFAGRRTPRVSRAGDGASSAQLSLLDPG